MALAIIQALNAATPGIASLILLIRNKDGSISVGALLDQADAAFDQNLAKASEWLKAHGGTK